MVPAPTSSSRHAEVALVRGQHRLGRRQRLEDHLDHLDAGAVDAGQQRLRARGLAGHQVDLHLEAAAEHAERVGDAALLVDDELLRHGVQDLAVGRQGRRLRRVEHALDVRARDLAVLARHRDHAARVDAADVGAGDAHVGARDLDAGHHLGLLARGLERLDRRLDVDDVAAARAAVGRTALVRRPRGAPRASRLADQHPDLRGADVDSHDVFVRPWPSSGPLSQNAVERRCRRSARRSTKASARIAPLELGEQPAQSSAGARPACRDAPGAGTAARRRRDGSRRRPAPRPRRASPPSPGPRAASSSATSSAPPSSTAAATPTLTSSRSAGPRPGTSGAIGRPAASR